MKINTESVMLICIHTLGLKLFMMVCEYNYWLPEYYQSLRDYGYVRKVKNALIS
jgi:hypothetical protein